MLHILTVHFRTARWIDLQLAYLARNLSSPYRVVANLQGVPAGHEHKFDRVVPAAGEHAAKLNLLAAEVCAEADEDDVLMFLDGDAFPIRDPEPTLRRALASTTLVAVQRLENAGDPQPHPSFCAVTVAQWQHLHGDWSAGYCWTGADGRPTTDVGGNLLRSLERAQLPWTPLTRTNRHNPHPLWFGIYGGIVYHHGGGFRAGVGGRVERLGRPKRWVRGERVPVLGRGLRRIQQARAGRWIEQKTASAERLKDEMYERIVADPEFYRALE